MSVKKPEAYFHMLLLLIACYTPQPYTRAECELAYEFDAACSDMNYKPSDDVTERPEVRDVYVIVADRDALGGTDRFWWCNDPKYQNNYTYEATFSPPLDSCERSSE